MASTVDGEERGLYYLIRVGGEFKAPTIPQLRQRIEECLEAGHVNLAIEIGDVAMIDSTGIGSLANIHKKMAARGGGLHVVGPPPHIYSILEQTKITNVLTIHESLEEADLEIGI